MISLLVDLENAVHLTDIGPERSEKELGFNVSEA
jgi:hypothetical protein